MLPRNVLLFGSEQAPAPSIPLRAGPLELIFCNGDLRYIRCAGREFLRRIYAAVRDHNWGTIPATISELEIDSAPGRFRISYLADHLASPVHFRWRALIEGTDSGVITFNMDGKALAAFKRNRIGLCVHHPVQGFAGRECEIESASGERRRGTVPETVSPHQPFLDIRAIAYDAAPGCRARLSFEGDTFEMEDQRNWCDDSFKTYGTPLHLPFPVEVAAGAVVRQRVTLRLAGRPPATRASVASQPVTISVGSAKRPLPAIGVAAASTPWTPSPRHISRLRDLNLSHIRLDASTLHAPPPELSALNLPVELAVLLGADPAAGLSRLSARIRALDLNVARYIVCQQSTPFVTPAVAQLARRSLPSGRVVLATRANFAELNRNRPDPGSFVALAFTANPQVHASDILSLAENAAAYHSVLGSALRISDGRPVFVSPLTLKMQFNPAATADPAPLAPGALPPEVDPRQMSLFCAAWSVAAINSLSAGGAAGVTLYETAGWKGIMDSVPGSPAPAHFRSIPGAVFPVWHALAAIGAFRGADVLDTVSTHPLDAACLALSTGPRLRLIAANLSPEPRSLEISRPASFDSPRIRILDVSNAVQAMTNPESFRSAPPASLAVNNARLRFQLDACALAFIDCGPSSTDKENPRP
ncbi:MAG: hypothetical protein IH602_03020 [Bryobacteraceae bacterium]|nr:hypothetical protein [Bryobacteraceae bacterium]